MVTNGWLSLSHVHVHVHVHVHESMYPLVGPQFALLSTAVANAHSLCYTFWYLLLCQSCTS